MNDYYVQTSVDDGEHWETIAAYADIESAVAVAKSLRVEYPLTGDALRAAIVCDLEEMEDNYNLPYIRYRARRGD
jgi:tagatose-1,6-bisphosphate aldolase